MKRWIAILLAGCLMLGASALAQDADASKLPAPEVVAGMEDVDAQAEPGEPEAEAKQAASDEAEPADEAADAPEAPSESPAADATEIPEAEPTQTPEAGATDAPGADASAEPTAEPKFVDVWFEEGFGLSLPEGWVRYDVAEEDRANGIRYALGDGSGERMLYIQMQPTGIADTDALSEAVENTDGLNRTGALTFGDTAFVAFIDPRRNASCCATLWNGELAVFMFTPQTDSDYMLTVSQLMESFNRL